MMQIVVCLTVIITTVYSDCCTDNQIEAKCSDNTDIYCHLKYYGIHCCDDKVKDSIALFVSDSYTIVSYIAIP